MKIRRWRNTFSITPIDEMFVGPVRFARNIRRCWRLLPRIPPDELQRRKHSADVSFLTQGITFTVYGREEGTERIFPYDLLPRMITGRGMGAH